MGAPYANTRTYSTPGAISDTFPSDWSADNLIEVWSAGGDGVAGPAGAGGGGGGAGGYRYKLNYLATPGSALTGYIGQRGGGAGSTGTSRSNFMGTTSIVGSVAGVQGGRTPTAGTSTGGAGNSSSNSTGDGGIDGAGGATSGAGKGGGGGGTPPGPHGAGATPAAPTTTDGGNGARGDGSLGALGGVGATTSAAATNGATNTKAGTGFDVDGSGAGGATTVNINGSNAGPNGGGGGGAFFGGTPGQGGNGFIRISWNPAGNTVVPTGKPANTIYNPVPQVTGTSSPVTEAGTYTGTLPSGAVFQVQYTDAVSATVTKAWTTIPGTPSGGNYSGSIDAPWYKNLTSGGMMKTQHRLLASDGTTVLAISGISTTVFGVGPCGVMFGSSTSASFTETQAFESNASAGCYIFDGTTFSAMTGSGQIVLSRKLSIALGGSPVCLANVSDGGTLLKDWVLTSDPGGVGVNHDAWVSKQALLALLAAKGGLWDFGVPNLGSGDARTNAIPNYATHLANHQLIRSQVRAVASGMKMVTGGTQRSPGSIYGAQFTIAKTAEATVSTEAGNIYGATPQDLRVSTDNIHMDINPEIAIFGARLGLSIAEKIYGVSVNGRGPQLLDNGFRSYSGTTAAARFTLYDGATGIVNKKNDGSVDVDPRCFEIVDSAGVGTAYTPSAANIINATDVQLTGLPAGLTNPICRYLSGANPGAPNTGDAAGEAAINCVFALNTPAYP